MIAQSSLQDALRAALDDEFKARATYQSVIDAFGPILPFVSIINSEQCHIEMLQSLLATRGLPAMDDPYVAGFPAPASIAEACRIGVEAEIENVALYDRLLNAAAGDQQVSQVFGALQHASAQCHLPAFRRALEGETADGCGSGHGHHHAGGDRCCGGGGQRQHQRSAGGRCCDTSAARSSAI